MVFSADMIASVRGDSRPEIDVLAAAAARTGAAPSRPEGCSTGRPPDPQRLFDIARLNKMLGWLPMSPAQLPSGCAGLAPKLLQVRLHTAAMNRHAMAVTAEAVTGLRQAGLRHVVLKGPFQQLAVHDNPFFRPSGDIDLYVAPRDRRRAGAVLRNLGFLPLEQDSALWWVPFLGEQHFRRDADGAVIDLHHRLQQAGLPAWQDAERVLDRAGSLSHADVQIPVLSSADGCLLMTVTLAKALLAHEPCGWAAVELTHWLARLDAPERARLDRIAVRSGQERTLALGLALARACDGQGRDGQDKDGPTSEECAAPGIPAAPRGLPMDPDLLRDLVFQPWQREAEAPRRRELLWMLARGRPHVLALEAVRAALSNQVRAMLERRAGKPSMR
ncbi:MULTISPECIES: nucleotidyltransferase family protein [Paracoccus]|uniref:nucleotidyltransferase family protein n=1 Tax=Paracoccus TaxID=265 RepID=UPI0008687D9C|nr:MAG: hypothetical protein ABS73_16210 [Paracoccus sp. SCN 68-21]